MAGFLDNSGDIDIDAELTDSGRKRLAKEDETPFVKGDGSDREHLAEEKAVLPAIVVTEEIDKASPKLDETVDKSARAPLENVGLADLSEAEVDDSADDLKESADEDDWNEPEGRLDEADSDDEEEDDEDDEED